MVWDGSVLSELFSRKGEDVLRVLTEQKVLSERVFRAMKEEHIVRLLQCGGMPVGGHALLWEMWEREYADSPRVPSDIPSEFIRDAKGC